MHIICAYSLNVLSALYRSAAHTRLFVTAQEIDDTIEHARAADHDLNYLSRVGQELTAQQMQRIWDDTIARVEHEE